MCPHDSLLVKLIVFRYKSSSSVFSRLYIHKTETCTDSLHPCYQCIHSSVLFFIPASEIRHQRGRPGLSAVPRPEAAHRHRQGDHPGAQDPAAGRGHLRPGHGEREGAAPAHPRPAPSSLAKSTHFPARRGCLTFHGHRERGEQAFNYCY